MVDAQCIDTSCNSLPSTSTYLTAGHWTGALQQQAARMAPAPGVAHLVPSHLHGDVALCSKPCRRLIYPNHAIKRLQACNHGMGNTRKHTVLLTASETVCVISILRLDQITFVLPPGKSGAAAKKEEVVSRAWATASCVTRCSWPHAPSRLPAMLSIRPPCGGATSEGPACQMHRLPATLDHFALQLLIA